MAQSVKVYGAMWTQFEVDYFAEQDDCICEDCGSHESHGWMGEAGGELCDACMDLYLVQAAGENAVDTAMEV